MVYCSHGTYPAVLPALPCCDCLMCLLRATAIEMVTALAQSQHGRQYLAQQGIMDKISNMIRGADTDPLSSLYLPGEALSHEHPDSPTFLLNSFGENAI